MTKENWEDIPGYEGYYQVSNLGNIKSLSRVVDRGSYSFISKEKLLKFREATQGRYYVDLQKDKNVKRFYVHKLVALAFIGECPKGMNVCHINGNCQDNTLANLRYDTQRQNQIDIYRYGKRHGNSKLSIEQILKIRSLYKTNRYTTRELAKMFSVSQNCTQRIVRKVTFSWLNDDGSISESKTGVY
ncbi:NUMOD4 domain-containing protein [Staphylococcus xylosus]|uniref:NUMOD4 domain-containing protein n=1 Tax=Staphylococcus xylosus TaxID=1288 RepID=UPI002DC06525|nr:NUMOD4 domain-containing protein [Staphylococcus xylosus]MEB8150467.1 NUMOD4 domain-containing protein [Staphylococcus xylosus]